MKNLILKFLILICLPFYLTFIFILKSIDKVKEYFNKREERKRRYEDYF